MERTLKQRNTTGCLHMRRRAKKHSKMQTWSVWRDFVEHEQQRREQKRQLEEAAEKARLALLELEEQQRREKETVCGMAANLSAQQERQARLEERNHTLEQVQTLCAHMHVLPQRERQRERERETCAYVHTPAGKCSSAQGDGCSGGKIQCKGFVAEGGH